MGVTYKAVEWNAFKKRYDLVLLLGIVLYVVAFAASSLVLFPNITIEILLIRAVGSAALILLHLILVIGPLARIDSRWLPLLYNRRHLGVATFLLGLLHGILVLLTYHAGTDLNLLEALLITDLSPGAGEYPFQVLGLGALLILFVMAATSHDFWLANLTAPAWKAIHMGVYLAYALLLGHVLFGALQAEANPIYPILLGIGAMLVSGLHLFSGWKEAAADRTRSAGQEGWVRICAMEDLVENVPLGVAVEGERVAVLRYEGDRVSAVSGVCQHQNGPLAEGRYIKGCLTCPWHGYQYDPATGCSPEPFTEKIPTFPVRIEKGWVLVRSRPNPAGTPVEPARVGEIGGAAS